MMSEGWKNLLLGCAGCVFTFLNPCVWSFAILACWNWMVVPSFAEYVNPLAFLQIFAVLWLLGVIRAYFTPPKELKDLNDQHRSEFFMQMVTRFFVGLLTLGMTWIAARIFY